METNNVTIILVHGAWGDGSHWKHVIENLHNEGYKVRSVQNPLTTMEDDIQKPKILLTCRMAKFFWLVILTEGQ